MTKGKRDMKTTETGHSTGTDSRDISRAHALLKEGCPDVPGDISTGTNSRDTGHVSVEAQPAARASLEAS